MALRKLFRPLRPDLDKFLFAAVGTERDGMPLSTVSALARLGLDPWEEAGRLSSLGKPEAVEQLATRCRSLIEALYFDTRQLSYEEISAEMGLPVASIGPTRARCLDKLRTILRRHGIK